MSYESDLKKAKTIEEIQATYDEVIENIAKKSLEKAILEDFELWLLAIDRVDELFPELLENDDATNVIISRY